MSHIDKLAWLYLKDRRLLVVRSQQKSLFYLPGGKREPGESDATALIREIGEELSVTLLPDSLQFTEFFKAQADGKPQGVQVQLTCYQAEYSGQLQPAAEIEELAWFNSADLERSSLVATLVLNWLKERDLID
jgi:8-oxo-dGTP diphosphatase